MTRVLSRTSSQRSLTAEPDSPRDSAELSNDSGSSASTTIKSEISPGALVKRHPPVFPRRLVTKPMRFSS